MGHTPFACCHEGCAHVICFEPEVEARLRRTHEWWACPAGHRQHFAGKTEQERRLERLEAENARLRRALEAAVHRLASRHVCWCGSSFDSARQLNGHRMGSAHWQHRELAS